MKVLNKPRLSILDLMILGASPAAGWVAWEFAGGISDGAMGAMVVTLTGLALVYPAVLCEQYVVRRRRACLSFGETAGVVQSAIVAAIVGAFVWRVQGWTLFGLLVVQGVSGVVLAPSALLVMSMGKEHGHTWLDYLGPLISIANSVVIVVLIFL